jgi:hypothetical protein
MSMAPPPNPEDELRSRAEYYHAYTREYFTQESDCLGPVGGQHWYNTGTAPAATRLTQKEIDRYLYYVRKGEKDRRWLLGDMMFDDPFKDHMQQRQPMIDHFIASSQRYLQQQQQQQTQGVGNGGGTATANTKYQHRQDSTEQVGTKKKQPLDDGFLDDDDHLPEWWNKKN